MQLLIFEYITGGGFNRQTLPDSLLNEGQLMLSALLANLQVLNNIHSVVMLDYRVNLTSDCTIINITATDNTLDIFKQLINQSDAVWLIAPEFDNILENLSHIVTSANKILLNSPASAVAITANKWLSYLRLKQYAINTVATAILKNTVHNPLKNSIKNTSEWIIKPIDGVGCSDTYVLNDWQQLKSLPLKINHTLIQPHLLGKKTSLSAVFKQGKAWLLCVNEQHFKIINNAYQLKSISVNSIAKAKHYEQLLAQIATAFPELWGYVGIDLIETDNAIFVLEINPRLTSSFVGIYQATGINVAEVVLSLLTGEAVIKATRNDSVNLKF
ncbi:MAG: ATP-grasp domain-containing protein [Methylococcaceae bacterium]